MKLLNNISLVKLQVITVLANIALVILLLLNEGCVLEVETEPITIEVPTIEISLTESMDCDKHDLAQYLTYPVCDEYDRKDCCNLRWSAVCMISFCDGCIGLEDMCYGSLTEDSDGKG